MKEFFGLLFFFGGRGLFQEFVIFWKTAQKHVYASKINFVVLGGGSQKSISKEQRGRFGSRKHQLPIGCERKTQIGYDHDMVFQTGKSLSAVVPSGKLMAFHSGQARPISSIILESHLYF